MKVKEPSDCGLTKEHDYLGHFKNPVHLNRGHNTDLMGLKQKKIYEEATGASIDDSETPQPTTSQGVTTGPKGPGPSKPGFIAEQLKRGKDQATAQRMADQIYGKDGKDGKD